MCVAFVVRVMPLVVTRLMDVIASESPSASVSLVSRLEMGICNVTEVVVAKASGLATGARLTRIVPFVASLPRCQFNPAESVGRIVVEKEPA